MELSSKSCNTSHLAFETMINRAIASIGLNLQKINIRYDNDTLNWEWIGYLAPQLRHWVTIQREDGNWHISAVTERCGVLKIIHGDLEAALTELMLITVPSAAY